jgi:ketosteroid isomerase-like protein
VSHSDFDVVRGVYEALNDGDIDRMLPMIDPEVEWQPGRDNPFAGKHVGRESLERFVRSWAASFDKLHIDVGEPRTVRDWFVASLRQRGRPRGGTVEIDTTLTHAWRVEDGRVKGWASFADEDEALAALEREGPVSALDVEELRRGYEAWNRGEIEAVVALVDPEIEWSPGEDAPEAGRFTGRDGFTAFIASWSQSFDDFRLEPEEITVAGDRAIVELRQSGRGRGSGVELDIRTVHVWTIRDGIAVEWEAYRNRDQALRAIG